MMRASPSILTERRGAGTLAASLRGLALAGATMLGVACGGSARELGDLRDELARVQRDHDTLRKRLDELSEHAERAERNGREEREERDTPGEHASREGPGLGPASSAPSPASPTLGSSPNLETEGGATQPVLRVVKLAPPMVSSVPATNVEAAPASNGSGGEDEEARPVLRVGPGGILEQSIPDDNTPARSKGKNGAPALEKSALADYDAAMRLVKGKKYKAALDAFAGFIVRFPDHPYAANALYWRGECYYALGDFAGAKAQFEGLAVRYSASNKAPDALLKWGLCDVKLGNPERARATWKRLQTDYPNAPATKKIPTE